MCLRKHTCTANRNKAALPLGRNYENATDKFITSSDKVYRVQSTRRDAAHVNKKAKE